MLTGFTDPEFLMNIPKVELHLHLEGAIPLQTLFDLIQQKGDPSIKTTDDLKKALIYTDFPHFIDTWIWKNTFITEEKDFEEITYQVLQTLNHHHVHYVEAFYSPSDFEEQGLSAEGITEYIIRGKKRAYHEFGIRSAFIMDIVRGCTPEEGMQRLEEITPYLGEIIGIGLGGSEQKYPPDPYAPVYREAKNRGFRLTAHAGEAAGPESIWAAIQKLGVERIGHGLRAYEDKELMSLIKERHIPLEMCVTSNLKTGVCESFSTHPIRDYFQKGLLVTVNSDDPTMFTTSITQEYLILTQNGFSLKDVIQLSMNGIAASFMSEKEKEVMRSQFEREWQHLIEIASSPEDYPGLQP